MPGLLRVPVPLLRLPSAQQQQQGLHQTSLGEDISDSKNPHRTPNPSPPVSPSATSHATKQANPRTPTTASSTNRDAISEALSNHIADNLNRSHDHDDANDDIITFSSASVDTSSYCPSTPSVGGTPRHSDDTTEHNAEKPDLDEQMEVEPVASDTPTTNHTPPGSSSTSSSSTPPISLLSSPRAPIDKLVHVLRGLPPDFPMLLQLAEEASLDFGLLEGDMASVREEKEWLQRHKEQLETENNGIKRERNELRNKLNEVGEVAEERDSLKNEKRDLEQRVKELEKVVAEKDRLLRRTSKELQVEKEQRKSLQRDLAVQQQKEKDMIVRHRKLNIPDPPKVTSKTLTIPRSGENDNQQIPRGEGDTNNIALSPRSPRARSPSVSFVPRESDETLKLRIQRADLLAKIDDKDHELHQLRYQQYMEKGDNLYTPRTSRMPEGTPRTTSRLDVQDSVGKKQVPMLSPLPLGSANNDYFRSSASMNEPETTNRFGASSPSSSSSSSTLKPPKVFKQLKKSALAVGSLLSPRGMKMPFSPRGAMESVASMSFPFSPRHSPRAERDEQEQGQEQEQDCFRNE